MEHTGLRQGILFLDEINCVSETLTPAMLQFLQNKTFGNQPLPPGWLIAAAGNPPEYNKSVRDFDIVTLDRVRVLQIEPEAETFLQYAGEHGLHGAVVSYLKLRPERFYFAQRTDEALHYVTARGWEDLSELLKSYEVLGYAVTQELIGEFLCQDEIVRDFYAYYRLYARYGADYAVPELLDAGAEAANYTHACEMARGGDLTERFTVINLLAQALGSRFRAYRQLDAFAAALHETISQWSGSGTEPEVLARELRRKLADEDERGLLTPVQQAQKTCLADWMEQAGVRARERHLHTSDAVTAFVQAEFETVVQERAGKIDVLHQTLTNAFGFAEDAFGDGQEMTLLLTQLTDCRPVMEFITMHSCPEYLEKSRRLLVHAGETRLRALCREMN